MSWTLPLALLAASLLLFDRSSDAVPRGLSQKLVITVYLVWLVGRGLPAARGVAATDHAGHRSGIKRSYSLRASESTSKLTRTDAASSSTRAAK